MPLTPHGSPRMPGGLSARAATIFGVIVIVGALLVALLVRRPIDGLMLGGFGLLMVAWGGLMGQRGNPRLLLALGAIGGLLAFAAAIILATR